MAAEAAKRLKEKTFISFTQALQNPNEAQYRGEVFL